MSYSVNLRTFFRRADSGMSAPEAGQYLAGFEDLNGERWGMAVPLDPDDVDSVVLDGVVFSLVIDTLGVVGIEAEGRTDCVNELIAASGERARSPLDAIVQDALRPDLLAMEDDARGELNELRARLAHAIELVDNALRNLEP